MTNTGLYRDIAVRTGGDIYIGVVGPVRTGKSTFIKKFMECLVIPNMENSYLRERAWDELPQSASGKTIMTTEPKFIPETAAKIAVGDNIEMNVRLIDCVGYIVPSSLGYIENDAPRMVRTPWFENPVPFNMAAEVGTRKVICEHSSVGIVVTTDGSISDIPRAEYEEAEERVIKELQELNKPFCILLNCTTPDSAESERLCAELQEKHHAPVITANCLELDENTIGNIFSKLLSAFPVKEVKIDMPRWICTLDCNNPIRTDIFSRMRNMFLAVSRMEEVAPTVSAADTGEYISSLCATKIELGTGSIRLSLTTPEDLFYRVLSEKTGTEITDAAELIPLVAELMEERKKYSRLTEALKEVEATGYGIVMPEMSQLSLEEPEIVRQGGRYGVRLRASAPSLHIMRADITTEVSPIVGSEKQSEELVMYLLHEFEENPSQIWESNIFGKSLHELVNEGLHNKLYRMPQEARMKLGETLERIINEGCSGLICIIL